MNRTLYPGSQRFAQEGGGFAAVPDTLLQRRAWAVVPFVRDAMGRAQLRQGDYESLRGMGVHTGETRQKDTKLEARVCLIGWVCVRAVCMRKGRDVHVWGGVRACVGVRVRLRGGLRHTWCVCVSENASLSRLVVAGTAYTRNPTLRCHCHGNGGGTHNSGQGYLISAWAIMAFPWQALAHSSNALRPLLCE